MLKNIPLDLEREVTAWYYKHHPDGPYAEALHELKQIMWQGELDAEKRRRGLLETALLRISVLEAEVKATRGLEMQRNKINEKRSQISAGRSFFKGKK